MCEKYDAKSTNDECDSYAVFHFYINEANQNTYTRYGLPAKKSRVKIGALRWQSRNRQEVAVYPILIVTLT
jgi:hypothetical protein